MRAAFELITKVVLIIALLVSAANLCFAQEKPVSVPFTIKHGEIVLSVSVDSRQINLILDTGAVATSIDQENVSLVSRSEKVALSSDGKQFPISVGKVLLFIAGRTINTEVLVLPKAPRDADGLLGQNVLGVFSKVTIDYKQHVVVFEK